MQDRWDDAAAAAFPGSLGPRVYSSRLLGQDPALVLHGGGNTSVKLTERDVFGEEETVLYVKGSGWDLAGIEAQGLTPVRLAPLARLAELPALSDLEMVRQLQIQVLRPGAPSPSVEAILHAVLPYTYVDHTHADALVTLTNTPDGERIVREVYGEDVVVVPYVMPGFELARLCAARFREHAHPGTQGLVLLHHGLISFGATARESYRRMIALVERAEAYLRRAGAWGLDAGDGQVPRPNARVLASLRAEICAAAGRPMVLRGDTGPRTRAFLGRPDLASVSQRGPATPDHVLRTKRVPMLGRDVGAYTRAYEAYFREQQGQAEAPVTMLDPGPRVVLDPELGLIGVGREAAEAEAVLDIYRHTMDIIERAERLGGYRALSASEIFAVEYWSLEQAKLRRAGGAPVLGGRVGLVTGGASGIGRACVAALRERGAAVASLDRDPGIAGVESGAGYLGIPCDLRDEAGTRAALERAIGHFGGLDLLILNAGVFPGGTPVAALETVAWREVMAVNLDANLVLLREAYPYLRQARGGGRVVVIGSKNVPAPGRGAAAYSASKAALTQLARVTALEWGAEGIRVNLLHPDAVFDTGLWSPEVLAARAAHYGLSVEAYKTRNLLGVEVHSHEVAALAAEMCGPLFAKTTGAQLPVDGGNERVV